MERPYSLTARIFSLFTKETEIFLILKFFVSVITTVSSSRVFDETAKDRIEQLLFGQRFFESRLKKILLGKFGWKETEFSMQREQNWKSWSWLSFIAFHCNSSQKLFLIILLLLSTLIGGHFSKFLLVNGHDLWIYIWLYLKSGVDLFANIVYFEIFFARE